MKPFLIFFFCVYLPAFIVAAYYVVRWLIVAVRWHIRLARKKGWLAAVLNFYNPLRLVPTIRAICQEVPNADLYFRRSLYWMCIGAILQIALSVLLFHYLPR